MKDFLVFLAKAVVVLVVIVVILWAGSALIGRNMINTCAVANNPSPSGERTFEENENSDTTGTLVLGEPSLCDYAEGYDSDGKVVPRGTKVFGPAAVKPDRDTDWGLPIYVGEEYITSESDEVVWLLVGDNACVDSQGRFFVPFSKTKPD